MACISPSIFSILAEESGERVPEFSDIHIWGWISQINVNKWGGTLADR